MFKVNNRNTRTRCETYSKLTIKTPERRCNCQLSIKTQNCKKAALHLHVAMKEKLILEIFILSYSTIYISIIKIGNNTFWLKIFS